MRWGLNPFPAKASWRLSILWRLSTSPGRSAGMHSPAASHLHSCPPCRFPSAAPCSKISTWREKLFALASALFERGTNRVTQQLCGLPLVDRDNSVIRMG